MTRYCDPDYERDGDPCRHCGKPRLETGRGEGVYGLVGAKPCPVLTAQESGATRVGAKSNGGRR